MYTALQRQMILWTSTLVVAFGIIVILMLLQPPTAEADLVVSRPYARAHKIQKAQREKLLAQKEREDGRMPASQQPVALAATASDDPNSLQAIDVKLPCMRDSVADSNRPKTPLARGVSQARFLLDTCKAEIESIELRNLTNSFSATVFRSSATRFTTDYITIAPGENAIRVTYIMKDGKREERDYFAVRE